MKRNHIIVIVIGVAAILALLSFANTQTQKTLNVYCVNDNCSPRSIPMGAATLARGCYLNQNDCNSALTSTSAPAPSVREFTIIAKQFEFDVTDSNGKTTVNEIGGINKGDTVKLHIKSVDVSHGFTLPAFSVNEELTPGQTVDVKFIADKSGTFGFACTIFCGAHHSSMRGNFTVS